MRIENWELNIDQIPVFFLHPEDVVPAINVNYLAGNSTRHGARKKKGGIANFVEFHGFSQWGTFGVQSDHV